MELGYFTYITGLASLLSFVAQMLGWFPQHKGFRKGALLVITGLFIGSLSSAFNASNINFEFTISGFTLVVVTVFLLVIGFLAAAGLSHNEQKRGEFYAVSGIAGFALFMILMVGGMATSGSTSVAIQNEKKKLTISELVHLSEVAKEKGDFDRALMHLMSVRARIQSADPRMEKLMKKIDQIKSMQL